MGNPATARRTRRHSNLEKAWAEATRRYDGSRREISLQEGDVVLIRLSDYERGMFPTMKLAPRWSDPGEVLELLTSGTTYRVRRADGSIETVNVERLWLLPVTGSAWEEDSPKVSDDSSSGDSCYVEIEDSIC